MVFCLKILNLQKFLKKNNIKFIGPSSNLIKMMGDKIEAKKIAKEYGLPVIEGSDGGVSDFDKAKEIGKKVGFPILIKAAGGGGGKGMKIVKDEKNFEELFLTAKSEAKKYFETMKFILKSFLKIQDI